ncbi:MAG: pseudomurein-binding protein, partial [Methanobacterium sp.]|nr:pseudomurein-binding protein [Methanobacterium sp.]
TQTLTMPQFLYLLVTATGNVNVGNLNPITVIAVNPAPSPSGSYTHGNLLKASYVTVAGNIRNFILANGRAPNYAQTSLGKIPFAKLVYMYSKVMNFYGNIIPNRLPNYVYI